MTKQLRPVIGIFFYLLLLTHCLAPFAVAAPPTAATLKYEFPADHAIGRLYMAKIIQDGLIEKPASGKRFVDARGTVILPSEQRLSLLLNYSGAQDPTFLDRFSPECRARFVEADLRNLDNLSDETIRHFSGFKEIRHFICDNTDITDKSLEYIATFDELRSISLSGTLVKGTGLAKLTKLAHLKSLSLAQTNLRKANLSPLADFKCLVTLSLCVTEIPDSALVPVGKIKTLLGLDLSRNKITDAGLAKLSELRLLQNINLADTRVTVKGMAAALQKLPSLKLLAFDEGQLSDKDAAELRKLLPRCRLEFYKLNRKQYDPGLFAPLR